VHLNEFPARVERLGEPTLVNYRVLIERAEPGPWRARLFTKDAQLRGELPRVSRVVHVADRQWLAIGETDAWRITRLTGCGCSASQLPVEPAIQEWLQGVVAAETWEAA